MREKGSHSQRARRMQSMTPRASAGTRRRREAETHILQFPENRLVVNKNWY